MVTKVVVNVKIIFQLKCVFKEEDAMWCFHTKV